MIDRTLARLAAKARLPEWAAALSVIVLMDAVIAVAIVAAVRTNGAEGNPPAASVSPPPAGMPDALNYLEIPRLGVGKTAAQIRARFGPEDQIEVARDGTIHVLRYNMRVYGIENGVRHELVRPVVFFFGPGGLCHTAG